MSGHGDPAAGGAERAQAELEDAEARAEQEADRLEERTDALGEQIDDTRTDWERKKADPAVPGAAGDPERAEGGLPPQADEASGDARDATPGGAG